MLSPPATSAPLVPRTKRMSPKKYLTTYSRHSKGKASSGVKTVSLAPLSMSGLDESLLVDVKVLTDDLDVDINSLKGVVATHKQPRESF